MPTAATSLPHGPVPPAALVAFLRARLDEDEAAAQAVLARQHVTDSLPKAIRPWDLLAGGELDPAVRRLLAEVEAKRLIIMAAGVDRGHLSDLQRGQAVAYQTVLKFLASVYAEHPDFREEWRS